jgi:hypothetical protein
MTRPTLQPGWLYADTVAERLRMSRSNVLKLARKTWGPAGLAKRVPGEPGCKTTWAIHESADPLLAAFTPLPDSSAVGRPAALVADSCSPPSARAAAPGGADGDAGAEATERRSDEATKGDHKSIPGCECIACATLRRRDSAEAGVAGVVGETFAVEQRLRIQVCGTCGIVFAAPRGLVMFRAHEGMPLFCPAGHANELHSQDGPPADPIVANVWLLAELLDAQHRLKLSEAELQRALARVPQTPARAIDAKELRRRCRLLAAMATPMGYGRKLCRVCGKEQRGSYLAQHLEKRHSEEVEQMAAEAFE